MRLLITFCMVCLSFVGWAEESYRPKVPSSLEFAGMHLKITESARKEIQKDVDMLTNSTKYFEIKADRARLYFPIIEKVLKEQGVPEDFKYLSVQESALISDAVSSANAVGFWQFKDFTGREVGLRIDKSVDERLNIVASTVGASKYFKRHNFYFDNWVYTLLAHMTGRGGAGKYVDTDKFGVKKMTIDRSTHWYIKRCLAHKIAFEGAIDKKHSQGMRLVEYKRGAGKSLSKIASEMKVSESDVKTYNKWLKSGKVPTEKTYIVIVPVKGKIPSIKRIEGGVEPKKKTEEKPIAIDDKKGNPSFGDDLNSEARIYIKINGISAVLAKKGETTNSLAKKVQLHPELFAKYNDLSTTDKLTEGEIYYLKSKRNKGLTYYYTAQQGETLWGVSQKFGIKKKKLAKLNRMLSIDQLEAGRVMWLRQRRPKDVPVEIRPLDSAPVDETVPVEDLIKEVQQTLKKDEARRDSIQSANKHAEKEEKALEEKLAKEKTSSVKETEEDIDEAVEVVKEGFMEISEQTAGMVSGHVVLKGETLYAIAKSYGVSVQDLIEWNELNDAALNVGQELMIHGDGKPEEVQLSQVDFHVVEPGDTMYSISRKYNVDIKQILDMNQKDNFELSIGERIKVKE
ncbi:MAG: LysM peptidoglycan-binding domain-containing protein [Reichenbachiella sp.]